jgi:DNA repair exonuclease SbcCD ATPase subunit
MRIAKLEISNVMGVEHLELKAGKLNVIKGGNGAGKTSVLEAIKVALGAGRDATLIRQGQKSGKVVVVFDGGEKLVRSIRPSGDEAKIVRVPGENENAKPILDQLVQVFSLNPAQFLLASEKEQIAMIRKAIPQPLDTDAFSAAMGGDWWMEYYDESRTTDEVLSAVENVVYARRTEHNTKAEEKRATIAQLSKSLPADDATDPRAELEQVQADLDTLQAADAEFITAANQAEMVALKESDEQFDAQIADIQERMRALQAELSDTQARKREARSQIQREAESARAKRMQEAADRRTELQTRRAELQAQVEAVAKSANTREVVEQMRAEAESYEAKSRRCSELIKAVREFRAKAIAHMPIKGLEIRDGSLFVDGVPFKRVNTARKVQVAIQVARYGAGEIPVICVDGLECLEPDVFAGFCEFAAAIPDLQFFVTRVDEGPLRIETEQDFALAGD